MKKLLNIYDGNLFVANSTKINITQCNNDGVGTNPVEYEKIWDEAETPHGKLAVRLSLATNNVYIHKDDDTASPTYINNYDAYNISNVLLKVLPEKLRFMKKADYTQPNNVSQEGFGSEVLDNWSFSNSQNVMHYLPYNDIQVDIIHKYDPTFGYVSENRELRNLDINLYVYEDGIRKSKIASGKSLVGNKDGYGYFSIIEVKNGSVKADRFAKVYISNDESDYGYDVNIGQSSDGIYDGVNESAFDGLTFLNSSELELTNFYYTIEKNNELYEVEVFNDVNELIATGTQVGTNNFITLKEPVTEDVFGKVLLYRKHKMLLHTDNAWQSCDMTKQSTESKDFDSLFLTAQNYTNKYWDLMASFDDGLGVDISEDVLVSIEFDTVDGTGGLPTGENAFTLGILPQVAIVPIIIGDPAISLGQVNDYNNALNYNFPVVIGNTNFNGAIKYYTSFESFNENAMGLPSRWKNTTSDSQYRYASADFTNKPVGLTTIYFQIVDRFYNKSSVLSFSVHYNNIKPFNLFIKGFGTNNNPNYTGIYIDEHGEFSFDNTLRVQFFGDSPIAMKYNISGNVVVDSENGIGESGAGVKYFKNYTTEENTTPTSKFLSVKLANKSGFFMGIDELYTIRLTLLDLAGNSSVIEYKIRYNTKIYSTKKKNLEKETASYNHVVMDVVSGNASVISSYYVDNTEYTRSWNDVFYPESHSYPTLSNGDIDVNAAKAMNGVSNILYDAVRMNGTEIYYDAEQRPQTVNWTNNGTKNYRNSISSYDDELVYWIFDNTGYGEIKLEFEYFYLDTSNNGPPFNKMSPHEGDCVVVYNCDNDDAIISTIDEYGNIKYKLANTSHLGEELDAFSGSGNSVFSKHTGKVGATANGAFTTDSYQTSRVCVVFYSDVAENSSGFKIKASPKRDVAWSNWDVDTKNGLVWVHKYDSSEINRGNAGNNIRVIYNYGNTDYDIDYDKGEIYFSEDQGENIYAYYTYYDYGINENPPSNVFASYYDDIVEYANFNVWFTTYGSSINKSNVSYPVPNYPINVGTPLGYNQIPSNKYTAKVLGDNKVKILTNVLGGSTELITNELNNHDIYLSDDGGATYNIHGKIISNKTNIIEIELSENSGYLDSLLESSNSDSLSDSSLDVVIYIKTIVGWQGKLNTKYNINKDCGFITFVETDSIQFNNLYAFVPRGRIFMDYQYHTFLRLTNDGYGNFKFYDDVIVPDTTTAYPDYTWGDIKLVNEGDASLESGKMKFLSRGIDSAGDGVVDEVLNYERPWDAQKGAGDETYEKAAILWSTQYSFPPVCTRVDAQKIFQGQVPYGTGATAGKSPNFAGNALEPKGVIYGRLVWVLGGAGTTYPANPTSGKKAFSSEIEGSFYSIE